MATLRIINLTGSDVTIEDVGIVIPASGLDTVNDPVLILDLARSRSLRTLVTSGVLSLSDIANPVTLRDLPRYLFGCGIDFPTSPAALTNERWWIIQQNAGLTTIAQVGFATAPTATGTATVLNAPPGQFINYASGTVIGDQAGWVSSAFSQTRLDFRPAWKAFIRTGPVITNVRYWAGLFSATPATSDDPVINGMGFRYSTAVDGTAFWRAWSNDAIGTSTVTVTSVPVTPDTSYNLSLEVLPEATAVAFYINDALVATHLGNLPSATAGLGHVERLTTLDTVSKSIAISKVALSQRAM